MNATAFQALQTAIIAGGPALQVILYKRNPTFFRSRIGPYSFSYVVAAGMDCSIAVAEALGGHWDNVPRNVIGAACFLYLWWKCGGGDSTKKKLKKAKEAVSVVGSKLVAVPVPG
jgi:hypothetical protein